MTSTPHQAAVLGSGVVGRACALALAHAGLRVALVSADDVMASKQESLFDARVFALNASSRELLMQLKVWDAMPRERITPVERMCVDHFGVPVSFDAYEARQPALAWIVEQRELLKALQTAVQFHPNVQTLHMHEPQFSMTETTAMLSDASQRIEAPLVIGADVAAARLLSSQGAFTSTETDYEATALVGTLSCEKAHQGVAYQWFGHRLVGDNKLPSVLALLPMPTLPTLPKLPTLDNKHHVSLVWSTTGTQSLRDSSDLNEQLTQASHGALGALQAQGELQLWPLKRAVLGNTVAHRQVLLGDAAHRVHPLAGQGLNLGLQDIAELARVLAAREAFRDLGDVRLLSRYARARALPVRAVSEMTHRLWQITHKISDTGIRLPLLAANNMRKDNDTNNSIWVEALKWIDRSSPAKAVKRQLVQAAQGRL
jgi:2-polyprenylphenol 6-hydroxylase